MKNLAYLALLAVAGCESSPQAPAMTPVSPPSNPVAAPAPPKPPTPDDLPAQPRLGDAAQRGIPADGILIATRTDRQAAPPLPALERPDAFLIYKLTRTGVVEVSREEATTVQALAWLDRRTLLVYRETDAHEGSLTRIVDGVAQAPQPIRLTAWGLPAAPETHARLVVTARNELWLTRCVKRADAMDPDSKCTVPAALRVDVAPFVRTGNAPAQDPARHVDQPGSDRLVHTALPAVTAPTGYKLELFSVPPAKRQNFMSSYEKGFRCTAPDGTSVEWPYGTDWIERWNITNYRPSSVRWVSTSPPAYVVEGVATNMVDKSTSMVSLFRACKPSPVLDAAYLGGDLWAELDEPVGPGPGHGDDPPYVHSTWKVRVADQHVAIVVGSQTWFAPQPPR